MGKTHAGKKVYISEAVGETDLADVAAFEALSWTEVPGVGTFPEYGRAEAISTHNGFEKKAKGKGAPDFGGGDLEVRRISGDAGQLALRAAGASKKQYAFKIVFDDATGASSGDYTATTDYVKGVVSGPKRGGSGDEDFIMDVYALGFEQHIPDEPAVIA